MHKHVEMQLPDDAPMRIAVISDTHSVAHPAAAERVAASAPHLILHAGDIGDDRVLAPFEAIAPTEVVRGNIDSKSQAPDVITVAISGPDDYGVRIVMTHIAMYGGWVRRDAKALARRERAHLLVCGHSHVPFLGQEGSLVVFNPGSIGPRRPPLPISFGLMEFGPGHSKIRHVDCETGETWLPPALG